jgi:predicted ABC-type ATPase
VITILAGANNSGKTSLITLIKNVFVNQKRDFTESDIPVTNINEWLNEVFPIFEHYFTTAWSV